MHITQQKLEHCLYTSLYIRTIIDMYFFQMGVDSSEIGVIAVYRNQVTLISSILNIDVDVSTVDQFQGKEKSVIIVSCSKSRDMSVHRAVNKVSKYYLERAFNQHIPCQLYFHTYASMGQCYHTIVFCI